MIWRKTVMNNPIIDVEAACLFLKILSKCAKKLQRLSGDIESQEALLELEPCICVLDAWLNPETMTELVWHDIPLSESRAYVSSLCGSELNNSKIKQRLKNVLSSIKNEILKNESRGGCYGTI